MQGAACILPHRLHHLTDIIIPEAAVAIGEELAVGGVEEQVDGYVQTLVVEDFGLTIFFKEEAIAIHFVFVFRSPGALGIDK